MTENRAILLTAAIGAAVAFGLGVLYRDTPRHEWPWWAAAAAAASANATAVCIHRFAERKRVGK